RGSRERNTTDRQSRGDEERTHGSGSYGFRCKTSEDCRACRASSEIEETARPHAEMGSLRSRKMIVLVITRDDADGLSRILLWVFEPANQAHRSSPVMQAPCGFARKLRRTSAYVVCGATASPRRRTNEKVIGRRSRECAHAGTRRTTSVLA